MDRAFSVSDLEKQQPLKCIHWAESVPTLQPQAILYIQYYPVTSLYVNKFEVFLNLEILKFTLFT